MHTINWQCRHSLENTLVHVGTQNFIHNSISVHYSGQKRSSKKGSWRFTLKACSVMDVRWSSIFSQVRNGFWKNEHWNYTTYANKHYRYMYKLGLYKTILTKDFIFLYVNIIYFYSKMDIFCNKNVKIYLKHVFILFSPWVMLFLCLLCHFLKKKKSI